jgi:hypothetical protein
MNTAFDYLSLKKVNASTVDAKITEKESFIQVRLDLIFTDVNVARIVGEELINLVALKEAKLIIETPNYQAYEATGKEVSYEEFLQTL